MVKLKGKHIYILGGPNGAGKTTLAKHMLPDFFKVYEFVNADEIAKGISPFNPEDAAIEAGRVMLQRMDTLIKQGKNFAFETTCAGRGYAKYLEAGKKLGYQSEMTFIWLPNSEMAIERVAKRVTQGGHNIPEKVIRRRYAAGLANLLDFYLPVVDKCRIFDNSLPSEVALREKVIAEKMSAKGKVAVYNNKIWKDILRYGDASNKSE